MNGDLTTVVCQAVDVQDDCAGQLNADFDFTPLITVARFHFLLPSGISLINFLIPSLCTGFFLVSTFSFTAFCLRFCFKIFKNLHLLSRDQGHGFMYRGLDSQVVTPIENVVAFKVLGKSTTSLELDMGQYLFIMINYSARKCILYLV